VLEGPEVEVVAVGEDLSANVFKGQVRIRRPTAVGGIGRIVLGCLLEWFGPDNARHLYVVSQAHKVGTCVFVCGRT
jgi:hypothetical protein